MSFINTSRPSSKPRRVLSVFSLMMINIIAIDSLRNLPATAEMGLAVIFFYILASVLFLLPSILITAELATHYPKTGGSYVWVAKAFGEKWGFMAIWLQWIYNVFWYPTILSFIAVNVAYLINPTLALQKDFLLPMIIGMFLLATTVNFFGMKISGLLSSISAIAGTILPMIFIIGLGVMWLWQGKPMAIAPTETHLFPSLSNFNNLAFLVVIFFSLMGMEMSAAHAEEVKNPQRDFPRALKYSSLIIVLSMILASAAIAIIVPKADLNIVSGLDQAFVRFLAEFHLQALLPLIVLLMILGGFGGMAAWVIGPTKGLMAAAKEGCAPKVFAKTNRKSAPANVLIAQAIIVTILCLAFLFFKSVSTWYWILSDLTAQLALLFYVILFAAAIRLRYKTIKQANAYRIPLGNLGIWIVAGIGLLTCVTAILIGFIPPNNIKISDPVFYDLFLLLGIIIFAAPPLIIHKILNRKSRNDT